MPSDDATVYSWSYSVFGYAKSCKCLVLSDSKKSNKSDNAIAFTTCSFTSWWGKWTLVQSWPRSSKMACCRYLLLNSPRSRCARFLLTYKVAIKKEIDVQRSISVRRVCLQYSAYTYTSIFYQFFVEIIYKSRFKLSRKHSFQTNPSL